MCVQHDWLDRRVLIWNRDRDRQDGRIVVGGKVPAKYIRKNKIITGWYWQDDQAYWWVDEADS
jgi:hypothetical protein